MNLSSCIWAHKTYMFPAFLTHAFAGKSGLGPRGDVILQLDWTVGEIMRTLDSLNIADNTIFVFCSDNGPVIDDGYQDQALELLNGHTPMKHYRGGKYRLRSMPAPVFHSLSAGPMGSNRANNRPYFHD